MKKALTLITLLIALLAVGVWVKNKTAVWNNPSALCNINSFVDFKISKIEFKDSETVMHIHVDFMPHEWIMFAKESKLRDQDGKEYTAISGDSTNSNESNLKLGEQFWMDDSGKANFAIHFQPAPKNTKELDFTEGESEGAFRFWNISNSKQRAKLPEEWKNLQYKNNEVLPEVKFNKDTATINVRMLGYKPGMNAKLTFMCDGNFSTDTQMYKAFSFNDDGMAVVKIPLFLTHEVSIGVQGIGFAHCIAAPGETVECLINPYASGDEQFLFKGFMARTNTELLREKSKNTKNDEELYAALQKCNTSQERLALVCNAEKLEKEISDINNRKDICDVTKTYLRLNAESETIKWFNFASTYFTLLRALGKLGNININNTEELNERLMAYSKLVDGTEVIKEFRKHEFELVNAIYAPYFESFWHSLRFSQYAVDSILGKNGEERTFIKDVIGADMALKGYDRKLYANFIENINTPELKQIVDNYYFEQEQISQSLKNTKNVYYQSLDNVAPEQIFQTILDRYKGKTVFVDVWATWCGPCRLGHKEMAPVKEELADKDIAYVYISDPSSPLATWQEMLKTIPGNHYYLTEKQYNYIMDNIFHSNGIPTYGIYDRQGTQTFTHTGYPGKDVLKEKLLEVVK